MNIKNYFDFKELKDKVILTLTVDKKIIYKKEFKSKEAANDFVSAFGNSQKHKPLEVDGFSVVGATVKKQDISIEPISDGQKKLALLKIFDNNDLLKELKLFSSNYAASNYLKDIEEKARKKNHQYKKRAKFIGLLGLGTFAMAGGIFGFTRTSGSNGKSGKAGERGETGDPGLPGLQGQDGTKGDKGDKGETGEQGRPGTLSRQSIRALANEFTRQVRVRLINPRLKSVNDELDKFRNFINKNIREINSHSDDLTKLDKAHKDDLARLKRLLRHITDDFNLEIQRIENANKANAPLVQGNKKAFDQKIKKIEKLIWQITNDFNDELKKQADGSSNLEQSVDDLQTKIAILKKIKDDIIYLKFVTENFTHTIAKLSTKDIELEALIFRLDKWSRGLANQYNKHIKFANKRSADIRALQSENKNQQANIFKLQTEISNLNSLKDKINGFERKIEALENRLKSSTSEDKSVKAINTKVLNEVGQNAGAITKIKVDLTKLQNQVEMQKTTSDTNKNDIATNKDDIATNKDDIRKLQAASTEQSRVLKEHKKVFPKWLQSQLDKEGSSSYTTNNDEGKETKIWKEDSNYIVNGIRFEEKDFDKAYRLLWKTTYNPAAKVVNFNLVEAKTIEIAKQKGKDTSNINILQEIEIFKVAATAVRNKRELNEKEKEILEDLKTPFYGFDGFTFEKKKSKSGKMKIQWDPVKNQFKVWNVVNKINYYYDNGLDAIQAWKDEVPLDAKGTTE